MDSFYPDSPMGFPRLKDWTGQEKDWAGQVLEQENLYLLARHLHDYHQKGWKFPGAAMGKIRARELE